MMSFILGGAEIISSNETTNENINGVIYWLGTGWTAVSFSSHAPSYKSNLNKNLFI